MLSFQDCKLPSALERALKVIEFNQPTPIQAQAIPVAMTGRDLIASAQTGTGKTAAFCIPIATRLMDQPHLTALILAPTRELAIQIDEFWKSLIRFIPELKSACLIGGADFSKQERALGHHPKLIIATPGRLLDHINRKNLRLTHSEILVLDEADRMLDMGFAPQLNQILRFLPKNRQTLLFSATWDASLDKLTRTHLRNPSRITVGNASRAASTIEQKIVATTMVKKNEALLDEINQRKGSMLIFARTKSRTDRLAKYLGSYGLPVTRIHGGRTQGQRNSALLAFKTGQIRILVATDIAARGIDVTEIAHVINYDLPQVAEDYIHRIGRTGRAGLSGQALSLVTPEERPQWSDISRLLKKSGSLVPEICV